MAKLLYFIGFLLFIFINCCKSVDNELFEAVNADNVDKLKSLLRAGSDINTIGPGGQTPLMAATLGGKIEIVKFLLKNNADHTIPEKDGYTPMHGAAFQGRATIAKILIKYGLNPRDKHKDGYEPIHRAAWGKTQGHADTLRVFIRYGNVPYDTKADNGKTPLEMTKPGTPPYKYLTKIHKQHQQKDDL